MSLFSYSDLVGPDMRDEPRQRVRVKRVQCASRTCRVWHEPIDKLEGYCCRTCAKEAGHKLQSAYRSGQPKTARASVSPSVVGRTTAARAAAYARAEELRERYVRGESQASLARELGVLEWVVQRICAGARS